MGSHKMLYCALLLFLFEHYCQAQTSIIHNDPYYRGVIAAIPGANSHGEFNPSPQDTFRPLVTIQDGTLQGFTLRTVHGRAISAFQSIPYAKSPIGSLRFRDPVKNEPWNGTLNAVPRSPQCIQIDMIRSYQVHGQEDCLYLNVYTPQNYTGEPLPVMVWIHGGSFFHGSGAIYGPRYLLDRNVILVTINYRLGPFGFFSTGDLASPGNQGLKDQVMALRWVQDNIGAFRGDPGRVTIFGESAGAAAVQLHIISPLSRGLFHQAISQSGTALCKWVTIDNASQTVQRVGQMFNCPVESSEEMIECLRHVPETLLASVQQTLAVGFVTPVVIFGPQVEPQYSGAFMTKTPEKYYENGEAQDVPWIAGLNQNEVAWFVSSIISDPNNVKLINTERDRIGPMTLNINDSRADVIVAKTRRVWEYYLGDEKFGWETRLNFSRMLSDRLFGECTLDSIRYHSMYTNQPVYAYHFSYQGNFSNVQQFGQRPQDWEVGHMDELIYLMNNPDYYQTLNIGDPELEMSYVLTKAWEQFATHGIPCLPGGEKNGLNNKTIWKPVEKARDGFAPINFLDFNRESRMIDNPYEDMYNFWKMEIEANP